MTLFICSNCGEGSSSWMGRCPSCQEWDTFKQARGIGEEEKGRKSKSVQTMKKTLLNEISSLDTSRILTGIHEIDRVLGGGIVKGAVILLTGEPGIGKSTLILQSLSKLNTLYVSGEESAEQIKDRVERLKLNLNSFLFSDTLQVEGIVEGVPNMDKAPDIIVIDSIQTLYSKEIDSPPGNISQLRETTSHLIRLAKTNKIPIIIVGHVTKDGNIAGPKSLEHMVDAVISFEGEKISNFRILRAQKNRFGSTDEIGIFEMKSTGLKEVDNPLAFIDANQSPNSTGKAYVGVLEGKRPLFYEIQVLAVKSFLSIPRRVVKGVDFNKVQLLMAVIEKNLNLPLSNFDIYVNIVGGVDVKSPSTDLGVISAIISSVKNITLPERAMFTGEVGLLGEVRAIHGQEKIISEAKRLNFNNIFSSNQLKNVFELYSTLKKQ